MWASLKRGSRGGGDFSLKNIQYFDRERIFKYFSFFPHSSPYPAIPKRHPLGPVARMFNSFLPGLRLSLFATINS